MSSPDTPRQSDKFSVFPIILALLFGGLFVGLNYTTLNFEQFDGWSLLTGLVGVVLLFSGLIHLAILLVCRRWRSASSLAAGLVLLIVPFQLRSEIFFEIDRVRFWIFKEHYIDVLKPNDQDPTAFRWGLFVHFSTGPIYRLLIHDPDDSIGKESGSRSAKIQTLLESKIENFDACSLSARRLQGNYYSVVAGC